MYSGTNPDTVVYPGWIEALRSHLKPGVGAVGPMSDYVAGAQFVGLHLGEAFAGLLKPFCEIFQRLALRRKLHRLHSPALH